MPNRIQTVLKNVVLKPMHQFQGHYNILVIKEKYKALFFSFSCANLYNLQNEFKILGSSKPVHETEIPTKVLETIIDIFSPSIL